MKSKLIIVMLALIFTTSICLPVFADNSSTVAEITKTLKEILNSKTVFGEPIYGEGVVIVPIAEVNFGFGVGGADTGYEFAGGGGGGGGITPIAVAVIREGKVDVIPVTGVGPGAAIAEFLKVLGPILMQLGGPPMGPPPEM